MLEYFRKNCLVLLLLFSIVQCKKPYEPIVLKSGNNYLVVDGFINTSPDGITHIILSRTKNLTDTVVSIPERFAFITIESSNGATYILQPQSIDNGTYVSNALNLDNNGQYRLVITTADGTIYQSDFVSPKQTPAIDSVTWKQDKDLEIFVNTHDPSNNTRYYRWQFEETWEYHSQLESIWGVANGLMYVVDPADQVHICYNTTLSSSILLGTSAALSQDVISLKRLTKIPQNDSTLNYRLSILVKQYALSPEAYFYWQIIQKNSEQLGTLFDLQPSQLMGNIHSLNNPTEPVVGFISANTLQEKRIFINNRDLQNWILDEGSYECRLENVPQNPVNFLIYDYPDISYGPYYFISNGPLVLAKKVCLDCTLSGGTNKKPLFW